jgi:hypothetical protein
MRPEWIRAIRIEVFHGGLGEPSICVPLPDIFGVALGRPVPLVTALTTIQEGRGFNSTIPMPFEDRIRVEIHNESDTEFPLYYQINHTFETSPSAKAVFSTFRIGARTRRRASHDLRYRSRRLCRNRVVDGCTSNTLSGRPFRDS